MYLKKNFLTLFIVLAATVLSELSAAEPEAKPQKSLPDQAMATIPTVPDEPVIPKRELKFDASEEEVPLPLENMREGMLDQRYVATFRLVLPKTEKPAESSPEGGSVRSRMNGMYEIGFYQYLRPNMARDSGDRIIIEHLRIFDNFRYFLFSVPDKMASFPQVSDFFPMMNGRNPEYRLSKDIMSSIAWENPPFIEIKNNLWPNTAGNANFIEVRLLAPTDKQARQWVEKWLAIYDSGICYHAQKDCISLMKIYFRRLRKIMTNSKMPKQGLAMQNKKSINIRNLRISNLKPL